MEIPVEENPLGELTTLWFSLEDFSKSTFIVGEDYTSTNTHYAKGTSNACSVVKGTEIMGCTFMGWQPNFGVLNESALWCMQTTSRGVMRAFELHFSKIVPKLKYAEFWITATISQGWTFDKVIYTADNWKSYYEDADLTYFGEDSYHVVIPRPCQSILMGCSKRDYAGCTVKIKSLVLKLTF